MNLDAGKNGEWGEEGSFRPLFLGIREHELGDVFNLFLLPSLEKAKKQLERMEHVKKRNAPGNPHQIQNQQLFEWYALSRVSDLLLQSFLPSGGEPEVRITVPEFLNFFCAMGFESFSQSLFHPFFHEIVEVVEDETWSRTPQVKYQFWPGLMFGDMMFVRAGVRVRGNPPRSGPSHTRPQQVPTTYQHTATGHYQLLMSEQSNDGLEVPFFPRVSTSQHLNRWLADDDCGFDNSHQESIPHPHYSETCRRPNNRAEKGCPTANCFPSRGRGRQFSGPFSTR